MGPIGDITTPLYRLVFALALTSVLLFPLAVWKLVEIVWWLVSHLHWS